MKNHRIHSKTSKFPEVIFVFQNHLSESPPSKITYQKDHCNPSNPSGPPGSQSICVDLLTGTDENATSLMVLDFAEKFH